VAEQQKALENNFKEFSKWIKEKSVSLGSLDFALSLTEGNGLVSKQDIKVLIH
jgi:hypothetical protein